MSRERARARALREAERAAARQRADRARRRTARLASLTPSWPRRRVSPRRYGAMPARQRLGLAFGWVVVQWVCWQLVDDPRTRVGLAVASLLAIPLVVVLLPMKGRR